MPEDTDQRTAQRHRVLKSAMIVVNNGYSTISCVVKNETDTGARLKIATVIGIPDEFELSIMGAPRRRCRVVWRRADEIGITYLQQ
jgi:zona occludens toxin (predicted ATPase)